MTPEGQGNYKEIAVKLQSAEEPSRETVKTVLETGLEFTSQLILRYPAVEANFRNQTPEFKQYFPYALFLRLVGLYKDSQKRGLKESKSQELFREFKSYAAQKFTGDTELIDNPQFEWGIFQAVDALSDDDDQVFFPVDDLIISIGQQMHFIREWGLIVVPNNPRPDEEGFRVTHELD